MKISNLNPAKYKRFFAFGCSYTNYYWPTWADIIGYDIPIYENWGQGGGSNHFIFNSVIEANARYNFSKDDLVIVYWSTKEREGRYVTDKWEHSTATSIENDYGKDWVKKYHFDLRSQLVRDLAYIKATQDILLSKESDWANLSWNDNLSNSRLKHGFDIAEDKAPLLKIWANKCKTLYNGEGDCNFFDDPDVLRVYREVFTNISGIYRIFEIENIKHRISPNNDKHPMPHEALMFLDHVWPSNTISNEARNYATSWDYSRSVVRPPVHRL
jgi:hypothetical protein